MGNKLLYNLQGLAEAKYQLSVFNDFIWFTTAYGGWSSTLTDSGTAAVGDAQNGILTLTPSDGSVADNDEAYVSTTAELFKFVTDEAICFEAKIQFTEAATNAANVAVGLQNAVGANSIIDDGGGVKVSGSTLAIYKVDGGTVWRCTSSCNGTSTDTISTSTAGGSAYQILRIEFRPLATGSAEVHFFLDRAPLLDSNLKPIVHYLDYSTSPTEMNAFAGVKNGSANNQTLLIDYVGAYQGKLTQNS